METDLPTEVLSKPATPIDAPFPTEVGISSGPAKGLDTVGGLVATNEARLNEEADQTGFVDTVGAAFNSGSNMAVQVWKRLERESMSPAPDPNFDVELFIKSKKGIIPQHLEHKVRLADSEFEANLVVQDMLGELKDQDMLARRTGVSTFVAQGLAGIVDLDTPFALGLSAGLKGGFAATRWGRMAEGAVVGGASLAAGETLAVNAGTTGDWTSIPVAGLAGMVFGGAFGAIGRNPARITPEDAANAAIRNTVKEFDDFVATGRKMEERDIRTERQTHEDVYGTDKLKDDALVAESRSKATPEERTAALDRERADTELRTQMEPDVRSALDVAVSPLGVTAVRAAPAMETALRSGRDDIADELIARMEARVQQTKESVPGVAPDSPKFATIKENLTKIADEAKAELEEIKALRLKLEQELASEPRAFKLDDVPAQAPVDPGAINNLGTSVGARQMNPPASVSAITNTRSRAMVRAAQRWAQTSGILSQYFAKAGRLGTKGTAGSFLERQANRFHDAVVSTGLATDFDRLMRTGSVVLQKLAYDTAESASGIVRNVRSAAMLMDHYSKQLLGAFLPTYEDSFQLWAKQQGKGWYDRMTDTTLRNQFDELLALELNGRMYDPPGTIRAVDFAIQQAADAADKWSKREIEVGKGRPGETPIKGYDAMTPESGYMPQRWSSKKIEDLIRAGRKEADIIAAVAETYLRMHAGMSRKDATIYADAVIKRARAMGQGIDVNLIGMLQQDGRDMVHAMLVRNGVSFKDADSLIDSLTSNAVERGKAGQTKGRIDVDMRVTSSNGIRMLDLFDTDFVGMYSRRSRATAGNAALARKGIDSRTARQDIIQAYLDENAIRTNQKTGSSVSDFIDENKPMTRDDIENYFSYFDGGPVAGGIGPLVSNMKKLTNLALLNGLGLTQLAETGAMIGAVGISRWWDHAGAALRSAANDPKSALVRELKHMDILVAEDRLFRPDLNLEMDRVGTAQSELAIKLNDGLNKAQRIQGITSGFYAARNIQQRIAVTSAADKIMTNMKGLANDLSSARAEDLGLDPATFARIKQYVDNGTVEFKDGNLYKLNFDKWSPDVVEDFALSLNRHVNQVVQKAMVGEDNILFHKDGLMALFWHLKSFPMLAMEKQALRHAKMADSETTAVFLYGLATAATVFTAKAAIAGRTDDATDPVKIAKGAFGMSNLTGWIPMWTDPVSNMLGIESTKFNSYSRGIDSNVFGIPPAFTTLNRMANIPGAIGHIVSGDYSNNDVRAIQATPLIGNAYFFTYMFNAMKHTPESRSKERKEKRAAERAEADKNKPEPTDAFEEMRDELVTPE